MAIAPAVTEVDPTKQLAQGTATDLALTFDQEKLMQQLDAALAQTFCKVSRLEPATTGSSPSADVNPWVTKAEEKHADLLLVPTLRYGPKIQTARNDRYWLNLPLFAIGGPFCWFVPDRSYYCYSRLDTELFDVTIAAAAERQKRDTSSSRVITMDREITEASLNFLQRADGVGAYLLSVVWPAGELATEAVAVPAQLDTAVVSQLCLAMTKSLQDRANEITEAKDLVDFYPQNVRSVRDGSGKALVGEMVLKLGQADELGPLGFRTDTSEGFQETAWEKNGPTPPSGGNSGRKIYSFKIPLAASATGTVQVKVKQVDRFLTSRTFTFAVEEGTGQ